MAALGRAGDGRDGDDGATARTDARGEGAPGENEEDLGFERMKFILTFECGLLFFFQVEKDTILVCHGNTIQVVTMMGEPKQSKKVVSQLTFDFTIESIGELGG